MPVDPKEAPKMPDTPKPAQSDPDYLPVTDPQKGKAPDLKPAKVDTEPPKK